MGGSPFRSPLVRNRFPVLLRSKNLALNDQVNETSQAVSVVLQFQTDLIHFAAIV